LFLRRAWNFENFEGVGYGRRVDGGVHCSVQNDILFAGFDLRAVAMTASIPITLISKNSGFYRGWRWIKSPGCAVASAVDVVVVMAIEVVDCIIG